MREAIQIPRGEVGNAEPFSAYFRESRRFRPVDPEFVKFVKTKLREGKVPSNVISEEVAHRLATIGELQPPAATTMPMALGFVNGTVMGSEILNEFVGGPDRKAAWPEFGYEKFFAVNTTPVGPSGDIPISNFKVTWHTVSLDVFPFGVRLDRLDKKAGDARLPMSMDTIANDLIDGQAKVSKEQAQANFVRATGNYASASYYETLSGLDQWSDPSSKPVDAILDKGEAIRQGPARTRPDLFWTAPPVLHNLRKHPQVLAAAQFTGGSAIQKGRVNVDFLIALLDISIAMADAGSITALDGTTPTDIWGKDAGLVCTGMGRLVAVRFGITVVSDGFPVVRSVPEELKGGIGSDVLVETDAWSVSGVKSSAAYLWKSAVA